MSNAPGMDEQREKLFFHWSDSLQKFDHFVVGLLGAMVAYLIRDLHPSRLTVLPPNPATLEVCGIVALIVAVIAGVLKIERNIAINRISYSLAPYQTVAKAASGDVIFRKDSGEAYTAEEARNKLEVINAALTKGKGAIERFSDQCDLWYRVRNSCGLGGLLLILAARVLVPYFAVP